MAIDTVGIMFHTADGFPTLADVNRETNHVNLYGLDIPDEVLQWSCIAWNPYVLSYADRDHEAMDETNYDVVLSELATDVPVIRSVMASHPSYTFSTVGVADAIEARCAYVDGVLVVAQDHENYESMMECSRSLSDYPLLDESAYSQLDYEAWQEYAPDAFRDELRDAERSERYGDETETVCEMLSDIADEILPTLASHLDYYYGFSGDYGPDFLDIFDTLRDPAAYSDKWRRESFLMVSGLVTSWMANRGMANPLPLHVQCAMAGNSQLWDETE